MESFSSTGVISAQQMTLREDDQIDHARVDALLGHHQSHLAAGHHADTGHSDLAV